MKIYLGASSANILKTARRKVPEFEYGFCWNPNKMTRADYPYIIDNGAYRAFTKNEVWDVDGFVRRINQIEEMPREPDFVVLPDVVTDSKSTFKRSDQWSKLLDIPKAFAVQDGMTEHKVQKFIDNHKLEALYIGGTKKWKRKNAKDFVELAHENDLIGHIPRPTDLNWAKEIGADSVDTTNIARLKDWETLKTLRDQATLV